MLAGAVSEGVCYSSRCSGGKCQALKERYDGESATLSSSGRACKIVLFATLALIALFKRKEHLVFAMCCILTNASVMFLDFLLISSEIMLKEKQQSDQFLKHIMRCRTQSTIENKRRSSHEEITVVMTMEPFKKQDDVHATLLKNISIH